MDKLEINMNQMVKVKLTKEALDKKQNEIDEFNNKYNENLKLTLDSEGYYEDQLWCIMKDFGGMIHGCYSPISDCTIIIK